jgi:predicted glycosyltransferase
MQTSGLRLRATLPISGIGGGGALAVERALLGVPGVLRAYANTAIEMAYVEYDPAKTTQYKLERAIDSVGGQTSLPPGDLR